MKTIVVNKSGSRLDKFLSENTEFSRTMIAKLIDNGFLKVNGNLLKASYKVKENDVIEVLDGFKEENRYY